MVVHGAAYLKFRKSPIGHSTRLTNKQKWSTKYCIENTYLQTGKEQRNGSRPCYYNETTFEMGTSKNK